MTSAEDSWKHRIIVRDSNICAALSNTGLCDADLEPLAVYLDSVLKSVWHRCWTYSIDLDLSCNCGITDFGVAVHVARFLSIWPACRRLKLYQTSIGNGGLLALSPWVASGHARELHLSDLGGPITSDALLDFFREIHWKQNYPYWSDRGEWVALWLRLEHNGIENVDEVVSTAQAEGVRLCVLDKNDIWTVRPGMAMRMGVHSDAAVNLVLFRQQNRKPTKQHDNVNSRQAILSFLSAGPGSGPPSPERRPICKEPQPLSEDEYRLCLMEAREDEETGANVYNKDTFGDDADLGFSFEENLAANQRLASLDTFNGGPSQGCSSYEDPTSRSRRKGVGSGDAKAEIEEEIQAVLVANPVLRRVDFDGSVRQYLHAIRSKGGQAAVRQAAQMIHDATVGKERAAIQKWPAYLLKVAKSFLTKLKAVPSSGNVYHPGKSPILQCTLATLPLVTTPTPSPQLQPQAEPTTLVHASAADFAFQ